MSCRAPTILLRARRLDLVKGHRGPAAAGTEWINESQHLSPHAAFGGHKQSGVGVEGGQEGLLEFCQAQAVFVRRAQPVA